MNNWNGTGRLTKDPEIGETKNTPQVRTARYTLVVHDTGKEVAFISCVAYGKQAEYAKKYLSKGMLIAARGRLQTGSTTSEDGAKQFYSRVVVGFQEPCIEKMNQSNCFDREEQ